ncbi:hypothetical protein EMPS_08767 [Entomortierella parvispora]|uniref:Uncharacterized protein n=1 Tax=Entomortierella parvispora TaxID=205924 RepID=A0A9P3HH07_9FUNG|nr:hypothetical protein EMPS_08767 [Entomortierella parvispora]
MAPNARVSLDADLMTQTVACSVFPSDNAASFSAVSDCQSKILLFSVSHDGHFYLLHADNSTGKKPLVDLNECFGLPADVTVTAHAVTQDNSGNIYLAFSTAAPASTVTVYVVKPTAVFDWASVKAGDDLTSWFLSTGSTWQGDRVTEFYMSKELSDTEYPFLVVSCTDIDGSSPHLWQIIVTPASKTWAWGPKLNLPDKIMLKRCGVVNGAIGVFVYYTGGDPAGPLLAFIDIKTGKSSHAIYFKDASAMATFTGHNGYTDLLLADDLGLFHLRYRLEGGEFVWDKLNLILNYPPCTELRIAQTDACITVWAETDSNDIVYQQFDPNDATMTTQITPVVPLLRREQGGGAFAVYLDPKTGSQTLFIVGDKSQLTRLAQDPTTRLWQNSTVLVPATGHNEDFTSFTSHINVTDCYGNALAASTVLLCSSSPTDLAVNGESLAVGPEGVLVLTDRMGNITVIHRVDDIASVVLTIKDAPGYPSVGQSYTLNPAKKVQEGLAKVTDGASLQSVTLPDGSKLLAGSLATPDQVDQAGKAIGMLYTHMQSLPRDGSLQSASLNRVSTKNALLEVSTGDWLWDFWHGLEDGVEAIEKYVVDVVEDVAHWVISVAGNEFRFLLDSVTHVLKAASWVLNQVVTGIDKIIQWVGFLFGWDDILSTHDSFVNVVNNLFDLAPSAFSEMEASVDGWFGQLKDNLQLLDTKNSSLTSTYDPMSASKIKADTGPINAAFNTSGSNWSSYQLEHGGVGESLATANISVSGENDSDNPFIDIWVKIVEPTWKDMEIDLTKVLEELAVLTKSSQSFSLADVFTRVGTDLVSTMLDLLRDIVTGFLKLTETIISTVRTSINTPLNIPLLSPLYKEKTGKDLTILDAISLLLAIPTTVICKILTGKKLSELSATSMPKNDFGMMPGFTRGLGDNALSKGTSDGTMDKIQAIIDEIRQSIPYAMFGVNMACVWWGTLGWEDPTVGTMGFVGGTIISLFSLIFSVPDSKETRPGLDWRNANWILGFLLLLGKFIPVDEAQGVIGAIVNITQLFPIGVSIILDSTATTAEYPNGTAASIAANSIDRVVGQVAKILSNMCLITFGTEVQPVFMVVAILAAVIKQQTQALKLILPEKEIVGMHGF